ncbi:DUF1800 domain-containing protein [Aureitalea sp. L0-47]|uniref:DUF1800 domain-containing protein n=1 Tax=Aureitalea sp. L0-47 TaxID=2816962 RepID=UPI002237E539|nr:DUF1800 domain-containing protein [Aureitalea sp. L0-47]MCW5520731.1 DUF1800 domain-containing protein [Aureitalea sp. L0-47]
MKNIYHLYRRAAFGIRPSEAKKLTSFTREEVVDKLMEGSENVTPLTVDLSEFDEFFAGDFQGKLKEFRKLIRKNASKHLEYNAAWLERISTSKEALNERMTLFWSNHFVVRDQVLYYSVQYRNMLREHALGDFRDFTKEIGKAPSMMKYLNTNRNKKGNPNENYARELLELFTLGEGNYTEDDIKEAARAFTGWGSRMDGSFILNERRHDFSTKNFMGWKGELDGDDIVNIICKQKACATFICTKLYRYFVNTNVNPDHVEEMAEVFHKDHDIKNLMRFLFMSDWFYDADNVGNKIKSPIDLLSSIYRVVPFEFEDHRQQLFVQRLLGQSLLEPPNVAGWPGGRSWINSHTLMIRMKLASVFLGNGMIPSESFQYKAAQGRTFGDRLKVSSDWSSFSNEYGGLEFEGLAEAICAPELKGGTAQMFKEVDGFSKREISMQLMSLPEFQLT